MPETVGSALWGNKDTGLRHRVAVAALAAAVVLAAPAVARAGAVPSGLLTLAKANPDQTFDVIVQTADASANPADATMKASTALEERSFKDALKAADQAGKRVTELGKKAADAARKAADAQEKATEAAAKAAASGKSKDQDKAAKAQADADQAAQAAKDAQDAVGAAQADAVLAQLGLIQQQTQISLAITKQPRIKMQYSVIPAVSASVTGSDILEMQASNDVLAVTPDTPVRLTAESNSQKWVDAIGAKPFWGSSQRKQGVGRTPTIAIVDSGVDGSRVLDFGGRMLGQVNLTSLAPNTPGDGRGHGTMVASIAAGDSERHAGVDPDAPLISLDVINDNGEGRTSDVIAAADWILANRLAYNIRVANFSLQAGSDSSFMFDPLSKAIERLWFNGVVVVAAAGNYAVGGAPSGVRYAPASDPFVITVGAVDTGRDGKQQNDDVAAPWSSWGYTNDGFLKPDISAPGRYIIGACSASGTLCQTGGQDPRLLPEGYIQLSGTSFAAPMVSAAAAAILALHPDWTPDQVKGQLMLSATPLRSAIPGSVGVGELDLKAALDDHKSGRGHDAGPPNPNLALSPFIAQTTSGPVFDAASWASTAQVNASWNSASWSSASWSSASWNSASWASASWSSASWNSASWNSASWASSTQDLSVTDNAAFDGYGEG